MSASQRSRAWLRWLTALIDMLAAVAAFYLAYLLRVRFPIPTPLKLGPFSRYVPQMVVHVGSLIVTLYLYRMYHPQRGLSRIDLFYRILSATSIATLVGTAVSFLISRNDQEITRGLILYNWGLAILLVTVGRTISSWIEHLVRRRNPDRLLLVGTGEVARMVMQKTMQARLGYKVVGFVDGDQAPQEIAGIPVLGHRQDLTSIIQNQQIHEVIIALPSASHEELLEMVSDCESQRATVRVFPDLFQIIASDLSMSDLDGLPLLTVRDISLRGWKLTTKRAMDLIVSGLGLLLLSPLMLLIALLIKLESRGPVFYAQIRVGLDGEPFAMLKFRSMRHNAEEATGPVWATPDDPRRTRIGRFLRRTSLEELPQLVNVLLGEMSLVGPRPERPVFVKQFKNVVPRYMDRHKERAGLTGWAQVNGLRGETSIVERTKYDLYYIENWSLLFDIKIILRTLVNVLRGDRTAY